MTTEFKTKRRFFCLKRIAARADGDPLEGAWRHHQEQESGTALAATFPSRAALDAAELRKNAGLSTQQAAAVLAGLAKLL